MGARYLIDTNIAIYLLHGVLPLKALSRVQSILQTECNLSVITKMELLCWQFPSLKDQQDAVNFVNASNVFRLTDRIADQTILIRQTSKIKLPDAVIAATALVNNFEIVTRNESDYSKVPGLIVVNPFR